MIKKGFSKFALLIQDAAEKGILLLLATIIALIVANSSYSAQYTDFLDQVIAISFGEHSIKLSFCEWVNDFLMAIFFFLVGMEIKREMIEGNLASRQQKILPFVCAAFGVLVPVIIYLLFNYHDSTTIQGWAIPSATDIAFALGVLSLCAKNIPVSLKVFLTALAIIDDLIAIIIISVFYSSNIDLSLLLYIAAICIFILLLNRLDIMSIPLYTVLGLAMWGCFLKSGIHTTICGVIMGFLIPLYKNHSKDISPLKECEQALSKLVLYVILPLFAFCNSGLNFSNIKFISITENVTIGIILGLVLGKQIGVFLSGLLLIKLNICHMPKHSTYLQFYGVSVLCGVGFTMSLFIGVLAFESMPHNLSLVQLGVLLGSLICSIYGAIILQFSQLCVNKSDV